MMAESDKKQLQLPPLPGYDLVVGQTLAALEETRQRTKETLQGLSPDALDWVPAGWPNSIGVILYHLALVEADWLYVEILEKEFPPEMRDLFPQEMRDGSGRLSVVAGLSLVDHLARLDQVRAWLLKEMRAVDAVDWRRPRHLPEYDVTPVWVIHHLMHHEAEHAGHIQVLRTLAEAGQS